MEYKDPGRYIPIIYLLYSWGSLFGVPSRVPLSKGFCNVPSCESQVEKELFLTRPHPKWRFI